jgi:hypothetical protein
VALALSLALGGSGAAAAQDNDDWVARSDQAAQLYLDILATYSPEAAGFWGLEGFDEKIFQLPLDLNQRSIDDTEGAVAELEALLDKEEHPAVIQDLEILIQAGRDSNEQTRITEKHMLPYFNLGQIIFQGLRTLLDDQVAAERRPAAVVRLRKYTGLEEGYTPITEQAIAYTRAYLENPELLGPFQGELQRDLGNTQRFVEGLSQLFFKYDLDGWEEPLNLLKEQLAEYADFLNEEVIPRVRGEFQLPPEVYASNLRGYGVDLPVDELVSRAKVAFREIQNEMQAIAMLVAEERNLPSSDYRDVIRELKKEQLGSDEILPHYEARIAALEKLIVEHEIVTLPDRPMRMRLASEAESAASPAPNMRPPRLFGNTGEMGEFVLPLRDPSTASEKGVMDYDDFTFEAASWTLTVHEGRPGHELQFASIVEKGLSKARAFFAFNSTNVEGWALYAESEMKPMLPLEGQLISLQHRLLRAARAFLDPSLQKRAISMADAHRVLQNQVVLSIPASQQEVQRYTFRAPGQATSYFTGYQRLMELRTDVERELGENFNRKAFHDFVLAQGLLPPKLLRRAVMEEFIRMATPEPTAHTDHTDH